MVEHPDGTFSLARQSAAAEDHPRPEVGAAGQISLRVESAYLLMAEAAGINLPPFQLIGGGDRPHLLIRRFDWFAGRRLHLHSVSGLWQRPKAGLDYSDLFRASSRLGLSQESIVEPPAGCSSTFMRLTMTITGRIMPFYTIARPGSGSFPAFDLTYAPGMLSRGLTIAGEVEPGAETLVSFLGSVAMSVPSIVALADQVLAAIGRWPEFAAQAEVTAVQTADIAQAHRRLLTLIGDLR